MLANPSWILLVATQPTGNTSVRMRVWREVRALGAAILRDGVYLLPDAAGPRERFETLAKAVVQAGGSSYVLDARPTSAADVQAWTALFDRSGEYGELLARAQAVARRVTKDPIEPLRAACRALDADFSALCAIDYFPGAARGQLERELADLRASVEARAEPGEPRSTAGRIVARDSGQYRRRQWATRAHLWIDRVACAWLIRRFIDPEAKFVWLKEPADKPKRALGFDFDGADFTHVDGRVSFEVLVASFRLQEDAALARLGALVHALDVGGAAVPEAAGVEAVCAGLRRAGRSDDEFLTAASSVFDGLYLAFSTDQTHREGAAT